MQAARRCYWASYDMEDSQATWTDSQEGMYCCICLFDSFLFMAVVKLARVAAEHNEMVRSQYRFEIGAESPEQLVFIDESRIDRRTSYRLKGWTPRGKRAIVSSKFTRGQGYIIRRMVSAYLSDVVQVLSPSSSMQRRHNLRRYSERGLRWTGICSIY